MHGPIHQHLLGGGLEMLNKLGEEIAQKRDEGMPQIG
jgi:mediator of RNA polymerase II transcription subunit 12